MRVLVVTAGPGAVAQARAWLHGAIDEEGHRWDVAAATRVLDDTLTGVFAQGAHSAEVVLRRAGSRLRVEIHADYGPLPLSRLQSIRHRDARLCSLLAEHAAAGGEYVLLGTDRVDPVVWWELESLVSAHSAPPAQRHPRVGTPR